MEERITTGAQSVDSDVIVSQVRQLGRVHLACSRSLSPVNLDGFDDERCSALGRVGSLERRHVACPLE